MPIDIVVPASEREAYEAWKYAPAVRSGDHLFLSGLIGKGGAPLEEFRDAWAKIGRILAEAGLTYADIVEVTIYMVGLREHAGAMARARDEVISAPYPTATWIGVNELIRPGARAEIKVIARMQRSSEQ